MIKKKKEFITKIHLVVSLFIVIPVSFIYGFRPDLIIETNMQTINEHSVFKAIMGMYLAFAFLWFLALFKPKYLKIALVTNMLFMLGLGCGRLLSWVNDGMPSNGFVFGMFGELLLGFYGLWVLTKGLKRSNYIK